MLVLSGDLLEEGDCSLKNEVFDVPNVIVSKSGLGLISDLVDL